MDLLISTFITDKNVAFRVSDTNERLDVFKYMLASYSVLPIKKAYIFCKLDDNYLNKKIELENFIKSIFIDYVLVFDRFTTKKQWIDFNIDKIESDLIWFNQNDDHIFIDSSVDIINEGIELLNNDKSKYKSLYYSHFPEQLNISKKLNCQKIGNYLKYNVPHSDCIQIFNKNYLKYLLYELEWPSTHIPTTNRIDGILHDKRIVGDHIKNSKIYDIDISTYVPLKEQVRHFESYHHSKSPYLVCPPLFIPNGFFTNKINIKYCNKIYNKDYVNIHPFKKIRLNNRFKYINENELDILTDFNLLLEDIPLCWKNRINKIEIDEIIDEKKLLIKRNENLYNIYNLPITTMWTNYITTTVETNNYPSDWYIYKNCCEYCGKNYKYKCSKCDIKYCSKECQIKDWNEHKNNHKI